MGEVRVAMRLKELMFQNVNLTVAKDMTIHASKLLEMLNPLQDIDGFSIVVERAKESTAPEPTGPTRERKTADQGKKVRIID